MATMYQDKRGTHTIQFRDGTKKRTLRIGKMPQRYADEFLRRVDHLISSKLSGLALPPDVAKWLRTLTPQLRERLVKVGLLDAATAAAADGQTVRLGEFLDSYVAMRTDIAERTKITHKHTAGFLIEYFGRDKPLASINDGDATQWRLWLLERLGENTARRHCGRAKQFFRFATRKKFIEESPFADMKEVSVQGNEDRFHFVTCEEAQQVLNACPDNEWRILFALARFGGLRTPSEPLLLRWGDIDWDRGRVRITSPKTAHHKGKGERWIPLFPELRQYLQEGWDAIDSGEFVITRYRDQGVNLRTTLEKIIARAGLTPWSKPWQNLRATREIELARAYPIHVVCAWMGNSPEIAVKHYLKVLGEDFEAAATTVSTIVLQNALPQVPNALADDRSGEEAEEGEGREFQEIRASARECDVSKNQKVVLEGLESKSNTPLRRGKNAIGSRNSENSLAKCAANPSKTAPEPGLSPELTHFLDLMERGHNQGASGGEKAALKLAKAIVANVPGLDGSALAGAAEFMRLAKSSPEATRKLTR